MIEVRLCLFPPLVGFLRVSRPKLISFDHAEMSSCEREIWLRMLESDVLHDGLADLGMCFMIGP